MSARDTARHLPEVARHLPQTARHLPESARHVPEAARHLPEAVRQLPEATRDLAEVEAGAEAGAEDLRRLFRRHAAAVSVITTTLAGRPVGLLVTSFASVSADPPLVSFNVSTGASSWPALELAEHLGVHVLGAGQQDLAGRFARSGADRFAPPTSWRSGPYAIPLIDGVAAWGVARVEQRVLVGDHVIVVARLLHSGTQDGADPLVHHDGGYRDLSPENTVPDRAGHGRGASEGFPSGGFSPGQNGADHGPRRTGLLSVVRSDGQLA